MPTMVHVLVHPTVCTILCLVSHNFNLVEDVICPAYICYPDCILFAYPTCIMHMIVHLHTALPIYHNVPTHVPIHGLPQKYHYISDASSSLPFLRSQSRRASDSVFLLGGRMSAL